MELFWEQGYTATSLAQLTACMGINRRSLYGTHGGKRSLFLKALDRYCILIADQLLGPLAKTTSGLDAIMAAIVALIGLLADPPKPRACLTANTAIEIAPHDRTVADKVRGFHHDMDTPSPPP